jgi:carnitine O-acetyltransferase
MLESKGDYRDEAFLEKYIGGPLYDAQDSLPRLPIPSLEETLERFLPTALPLAKSEQEKKALLAACNAFPEQAKTLQERLVSRRDTEMKDSSWLQLWWNEIVYLQYRESVVVNVSYFFQFQDDPTTDLEENKANVQRAAALLFATAEFRQKVCSGALPIDRIGKSKTPLCATPYKYMFHACRIPQPSLDTYRIYDASRYTHAVIARNGHFFAIDIAHPETGNPLPVEAIECQLEDCIRLGDAKPPSKVGLLTSSNRDTWTSARNVLLEEGGKALQDALDLIESGAILLGLDDDAPVSREECCIKLLTGGDKSGSNRWFDKSIQLVVAKNGKSGILGEHSMMDGMTLVGLSDHLTKTSYADAKMRSQDMTPGPSKVRDIFSNVPISDATLAPLIETGRSSLLFALCLLWNLTSFMFYASVASEEFTTLINAQSNRAQSFQGYGSNFMKKAGHSPDAFVQMAIQLATYRLFGEQVGTYEATQVRPFLHGRTETTRAVSTQSEAFVKIMGLRPKKDHKNRGICKEKIVRLNEATAAHAQYTGKAAQALGVDRHFFGLSRLLEDGEQLPDLLSDPVFVRSKTWRTSTSHLTHPNFLNWGFGQVVPNGVGIGYSIHPNSCVFNVTALAETNWTMQLSDLLEEALLEMKDLIDQDRADTSELPQ